MLLTILKWFLNRHVTVQYLFYPVIWGLQHYQVHVLSNPRFLDSLWVELEKEDKEFFEEKDITEVRFSRGGFYLYSPYKGTYSLPELDDKYGVVLTKPLKRHDQIKAICTIIICACWVFFAFIGIYAIIGRVIV